MQFVYPVIFYLVLGILLPALVIIALWARWQRQRDLRVFGNQSLVDQLIQDLSNTRRVLKGLALLAGLFLLGLSLAGPQYGVKMVEVLRQGVDVIIILDVSQSMLAEDVRPNRLERAQQELGAFIDHLGGDRVGIIAFAGSAQVACPLTTDYVAAKMFLNYLSPQSVSVAGTELGTAIRAGLEIFPEGSEGYRVLVLLTDGEDHDSKVIEAAQEAKAAGVKILSIGFGSPGGEPIPIRNAKGEIVDYVKDKNGKTVMSRLDEATLKKITDMTGGVYLPAHHGSLEAKQIVDLIAQMRKREVTGGQYGANENRYQYVLLPALLLLLFAFWLPKRKGSWLTIFLVMLLLPQLAWAGTAEEVNKGNRKYKQGKYEEALEAYREAQIKSPDEPKVNYNIGNSLHQQERFDEAEKSYQRALKSKHEKMRAEILYNLGNTYFASQKYQEAAKHYREALKLAPQDEDTIYNLAQTIQMLKNPSSQQEQQNKDDKQDQKNQQQQSAGGRKKEQDLKDQDPRKSKDESEPDQADDKGEQKADSGQEQNTPEEKEPKKPRPGEMRPEEAETILDAVREAEKDAHRKRMQKRQQQPEGRRKATW
ncbi:tetratricopeptide repeat protein [bacterium]|nr:tetratricopeptide repeat protein [bacterium]